MTRKTVLISLALSACVVFVLAEGRILFDIATITPGHYMCLGFNDNGPSFPYVCPNDLQTPVGYFLAMSEGYPIPLTLFADIVGLAFFTGVFIIVFWAFKKVRSIF